MQWCHWWLHQHCVTLILASMAPHDQKSYVVPHFDILDLRNGIMPLVTPSASHDTNNTANDVTCPKESCCTSFESSWHKECNGTIDDAIGIIWPKMLCCIWFQLSWCMVCSFAIDDAVGITWQQCQCQWHNMTKKVMLCLIKLSWCKECIGAIANVISIM